MQPSGVSVSGAASDEDEKGEDHLRSERNYAQSDALLRLKQRMANRSKGADSLTAQRQGRSRNRNRSRSQSRGDAASASTSPSRAKSQPPRSGKEVGDLGMWEERNQKWRLHREAPPDFESGDTVYFHSKDDKQYVCGKLDSSSKGFWRIEKVVKIPSDASEDDPSRYIRTKPSMVKQEHFYKVMHPLDFEVQFQVAMMRMLASHLHKVLAKKKKHDKHRKKQNKVRKDISSAEKIRHRAKQSDLSMANVLQTSDVSLPKGDPKEWSVMDVQKWLAHISSRPPHFNFFHLYAQQFHTRSIDGSRLLTLTSMNLANDLMVTTKHRNTMKKFIDELKPKNATKNSEQDDSSALLSPRRSPRRNKSPRSAHSDKQFFKG